jgi:hypothetical protein
MPINFFLFGALRLHFDVCKMPSRKLLSQRRNGFSAQFILPNPQTHIQNAKCAIRLRDTVALFGGANQ